MQCAAKSKQSGQRCKRQVTPGQSVCYIHGGATPTGLTLPQTTHGRYSKSLPTRMAGRYEQAVRDTELLALREDVALLDARLEDVLGRVDTGESGHLWQQLIDAKHEYFKAKPKDKDHALTLLLRLIEEGAADYAAWDDVRSLLDQRRRLVESERKRLVDMQQTLTVEKAMLLVGAIAGIIRSHVSDTAVLQAISTDLDRLLHSGVEQEALRS